MPSLLLYRTAALITIGIIAGAVHSMVHNAGDKPLKLKPDAPTPLPPLVSPRTGSTPKAGESTATAPTTPASNPTTQAPVAPPEAAPASAAVDEDPLNITLDQAKALFDQGVIFIDSRHLPEYETGHVNNAFLLNTESFAGSEVLNFLDPQATLVVYCNGGACDASKNLVILLQQAGYAGGRIMHDGYPAWEKAGYPTQTGKPLIGGPK